MADAIHFLDRRQFPRGTRRGPAGNFRLRFGMLRCLGLVGGCLLLGLLFAPARAVEIPLVTQGGVYTVPARINDILILNFVVDSGASEMQVPADVVQRLMQSGTVRESDFIEGRTYTMADGSQVKSRRFLIRRFEIGGQVVENVTASVAVAQGALLLGQSVLSRFPSWSLDNRRQVLVLGNGVIPAAPAPAASPAAAQPPARSANPWGLGGPDRRDKRALKVLCASPGARQMLNCDD